MNPACPPDLRLSAQSAAEWKDLLQRGKMPTRSSLNP